MIRSRPLFCLATLIVVSLLAGCVKQKTVVTVNADGSGNIVTTTVFPSETVTMIEQMVKSMEAQFAGMGSHASTNRPDPFFDEKKLRQAAGRFGPDVKYVKSQRVDQDGARGAIAVYSFADINDIYVGMGSMMEDLGPSAGGMGGEGAERTFQKPDKAVEFSFKTNGPNRMLTISMPERPEPRPVAAPMSDEPAEKTTVTAVAGPGPNPMAGMMPFGMTGSEKPEEMMQKMLKGMEVGLSVQVKGQIVKTSSRHRDARNDARIVLMDMSFDKLMGSPEFKRIASPQTMTEMEGPEAAMAAFAGLPGVVFETNRQVVVEFK